MSWNTSLTLTQHLNILPGCLIGMEWQSSEFPMEIVCCSSFSNGTGQNWICPATCFYSPKKTCGNMRRNIHSRSEKSATTLCLLNLQGAFSTHSTNTKNSHTAFLLTTSSSTRSFCPPVTF